MRQTERTRATRRKLLDAAKRIFAKDGFEAARLEDIAAGAGYTRGAFYANFKSKEDIFFALFEEWVRERIESLTNAIRRHSSPREKLAALRSHYAELATDRRLVLISMEFKLFALRHPEASFLCRAVFRNHERPRQNGSHRVPGGFGVPRSGFARIAARASARPQNAVRWGRSECVGAFFRCDFFELRADVIALRRDKFGKGICNGILSCGITRLYR
jgi:AcrR family transcriptional regulator